MSHAASAPSPCLTWGGGELYKNGRPHRMLSGSMQYFRVHPDQWADRLQRLAALGMNTVDTYVAWNFHERAEGEVDFSGWRDLERYIELAGEAGLDVFLRPGPYICAEWSNGGLPYWLTGRARTIRTMDPDFIAAMDRWFDDLLPRVAPLQAAHGGPIVAVQVENEYGSFGSDGEYLTYVREALTSRGIVELLTTADGTTADMHANGSVGGALPTFTFGSGVERARKIHRPETPFVCSEMWGGWFDHWTEPHHVRSAASMMETINDILEIGGSFSLYMAHGGTNFGFWNGANHDEVLQPTITSYDYDAPIGEDGTINDKYLALREALAPFHDRALPELPPLPRFQPANRAPLTFVSGVLEVFDSLPSTPPSPAPLTFEELGAEDGFVAYHAEISYDAGSQLHIDGLHDRAAVFLDGVRHATLARDGQTSVALPGSAEQAHLTIIVESLGRVNYGPLTGERKGILGGVRIGRRYVHGWHHQVLPQEPPTTTASSAGRTHVDAKATRAGLAVATIEVAEPLDAWLALPGCTKALVWLNGFLLGRYWSVGPQETLYAPAPLWRAGANTVRVLDVDGLGEAVEVREAPEFGPPEEFIGS
ncbi:MAG TPA: beta-galactosidase family protein [Beutenbergiaceae bacterium]|nr:beta-galactosidase family protein [Beutenbergiaceae bacterium]